MVRFKACVRRCARSSMIHLFQPIAPRLSLVAGRLRRGDACRFSELELLDRRLAHPELLHLAGDGHREGVDELDVARDLVAGDLAATELLDLLLAQLGALPWNDPGHQL